MATIKVEITLDTSSGETIFSALSEAQMLSSLGVEYTPVTVYPPAPEEDDLTPDLPPGNLWPNDGEEEEPDPELDSAGVPHDERIHSKEPSQNKDGTWKKRRGVSAEDYERITAELKAAPAPVPDVPPAPVPDVPPAPGPTSVTLTWPDVNAKLQAYVRGNPANGATMLAAIKEVGVEAYPLLNTRPEVWQPLMDKLGVQ